MKQKILLSTLLTVFIFVGLTTLDTKAQLFENKQTITNLYGMSASQWADTERFVHVGDFNGDGNYDIILQGREERNNSVNNSYLLYGNSSSFFSNRILISNSYNMIDNDWVFDDYNPASTLDSGRILHIGDFNGDGKDDILLQGREAANNSYLLLAKSNGNGFENRIKITNLYNMNGSLWSHGNNSGGRLIVGDINNDGKDDVFIQNNSAFSRILFGSTSGLSNQVLLTTEYGMNSQSDWDTYRRIAYLADFNGDGHSDLILQGKGSANNSYLLLGSNTGFSNRIILSNMYGMNQGDWAASARVLQLGDFNGDGKDDIILQGESSGNNSYLLRGSTSGLSTRLMITNLYGMSGSQWARSERALSVGDFDGDGKDDVLLRGQGTSNNSYILKGSTSGLSSRIQVSNLYGMNKSQWADSERESKIGDFDGDGKDDIVLQGQESSNNTLLMESKKMSVNITGTTYVSSAGSHTWYSSISSGNAPYTYVWQKYSSGGWVNIGTTSSYTQYVTEDINLRLTVTDNNNYSDTDYHYVTFNSGSGGCIQEPCPIFQKARPDAKPEKFSLNQNYPNPFNPSTRISYGLPVNSEVSLRIYNVMGQMVEELVNEYQSSGNYSIEFDASNLSSGFYIARIHAIGNDGSSLLKNVKMQLIK